MYRKFYSYNDMPTLAKPGGAPLPEPPVHTPPPSEKKLFGKFESDDIILGIVILLLLLDDCDDKLLLLAIGFVFLSGFLE